MCRIEFANHTLHQFERFNSARVRTPFKNPGHERFEIRDQERETNASVACPLNGLGRMPDACLDKCCFVAAEVDNDSGGLSRIAHMDSEGSVQHVVDLEVRWDEIRNALEDELVDVEGAAAILDMIEGALRKAVERGQIPHQRGRKAAALSTNGSSDELGTPRHDAVWRSAPDWRSIA
jgi:hypothetical protein